MNSLGKSDNLHGPREKFHCLFCNKNFLNFSNHARTQHPDFYQRQLEYEIKIWEAVKRLIPATGSISPDQTKVGSTSVVIHLDQGSGQPVSLVEMESIDFVEQDEVADWVYGTFLQNALESLTKADSPEILGPEINHQQLEANYSIILKNLKRGGIFPAPRQEALALVQTHCTGMISAWQNRIASVKKDQVTKASGGFPCPRCPKTFKSQSAASNHLRKMHPEEYEKQIESQERATPATKEWQDYMIARRKFQLYVSQGRMEVALEGLREEITKFRAASSISRENKESERLSYQFLIDQARALFKIHYKNQEIPLEIQKEIDLL